jgi:hypothetical protein
MEGVGEVCAHARAAWWPAVLALAPLPVPIGPFFWH